jgi:hypothetical protein
MPLWVIVAIIVFVAARWIIYIIDRSAHTIVERLNAIGRILESLEKSVKEIERK